MNETLNYFENQSNYPELESDFAMKDALAEGDYGSLLDLRKESFHSSITEHKARLVEYLDQFMAVNQDSVFETASLDSFDESGLDMTRLSNLVSNLHTAQQAYLNYIVDLEIFVSSSYPEQSLLIMSLMEFSVELGNRTLLGDDFSREYPNLHRFINSNVEAFLSPEQRIQMHESTSRVARIDLQMNLNELIDIKIDGILGETFRAIEWRGNYPFSEVLGYPITEDDFVNSDLGQDLRALILSQLQRGYECEPVVNMIGGFNAKDTLKPFELYQISFRVTNGVESVTTPIIDASNYYHPYIHGHLKGDMNVNFLQRMSDVDMDYQASLAEVPEWNGRLDSLPEKRVYAFQYKGSEFYADLLTILNATQKMYTLADNNLLYQAYVNSIELNRLDNPPSAFSLFKPTAKSQKLKEEMVKINQTALDRAFQNVTEGEFDAAFRRLMDSGDQDLINTALNAKSVYDSRDLYSDVEDLVRGGNSNLDEIKARIEEIQNEQGSASDSNSDAGELDGTDQDSEAYDRDEDSGDLDPEAGAADDSEAYDESDLDDDSEDGT